MPCILILVADFTSGFSRLSRRRLSCASLLASSCVDPGVESGDLDISEVLELISQVICTVYLFVTLFFHHRRAMLALGSIAHVARTLHRLPETCALVFSFENYAPSALGH